MGSWSHQPLAVPLVVPVPKLVRKPLASASFVATPPVTVKGAVWPMSVPLVAASV